MSSSTQSKKLLNQVHEKSPPSKDNIVDKLRSTLQDLVQTENIRDIFNDLKTADSENGKVVGDSLLPIIDSCSKVISTWLANTKLDLRLGNKENLFHEVLGTQYLRDTIEPAAQAIRAKLTPYLSYSETMARRKADLQGFSREAEQKFIDDLMDEIGDYIDHKRKILSDRLEKETTTKERLADTFVKPAVKGVKWVGKKVGIAGEDSSWGQLLVERLLEEELGPEVIKQDIGKILDKAKQEFESAWQKKVAENPPDLEMMRLLAGSAGKPSHTGVGFQPEISIHVLTGGISAALAATFGLAVGWHTLKYALINVFPPAAIIAVLLTAVTFTFTGKSARESRKQQIEKIIKQYYAMLIISLFKQPLKELNDKTLPQALHQLSTECINTALEHWEKQISGKLTLEDYRRLTTVVTQYLAKLDKAVELLKETVSFAGNQKIQCALPWWKHLFIKNSRS